MTTKFLDNKICTFKIFIVVAFPTKTSVFGDDFPLCSQGPPPQKRKFYFIIVSPSLMDKPGEFTKTPHIRKLHRFL